MFDNLTYVGKDPEYPDEIFDNDLGEVIVKRQYTLAKIETLVRRGEAQKAFGKHGMQVSIKFGDLIFAKDVSLSRAAEYKRNSDADIAERKAHPTHRFAHLQQQGREAELITK